MRSNTNQLCFLVIVGMVAFFFAAYSQASELYSEQVFLEREQVFSSHIQVKADAAVVGGLSGYVEAGNEWMSPVSDLLRADGGSYFHAGPGLRYRVGVLTASVEGRFRRFYRPTGRDAFDFRSLIVLSDYLEGGSLAGGIRPMAELYSETLLTTADRLNLITANYARLGVRKNWGRTLTDVFIEPFLTLDTVGHFYNNRADAKLSFRITQPVGAVSIGFTASYLVNHYFPFGDFERNPLQDRAGGVRMLLTVGGTL